MYTAKERLHLARDGKTVVKPGDPRSASLLVPKGGTLTDAEAQKYGLLPGGDDDALSLEPTAAPTPPAAPPSTPMMSNAENVNPFPQELKFGNLQTAQQGPPSASAPAPAAPSTPPTPLTATSPVPPPPPLTPPAATPQQPVESSAVNTTPAPPSAAPPAQVIQQPATAPPQPAPAVTMTALPADFPHAKILMDQGYGKEKVLAASREELIGLNLIGTARADEILEARERLRTI